MNEASLPEAPLSRREEAKALFRNAILDAAERVFAEHGFHVARIQDVAKQARIGVGTVYNHFEQKEDLLLALLEDRTGEVLACLAARPEGDSRTGPATIASVGLVRPRRRARTPRFAGARWGGTIVPHGGCRAAAAENRADR